VYTQLKRPFQLFRRANARMASDERQVTIRRLGRPGDLGWVIMAHGEVYAAEFGWDTSFEALGAKIVADYAAEHDAQREQDPARPSRRPRARSRRAASRRLARVCAPSRL